ncbi:DUF6082 family protein [Streptomyces lutosisoli]|uniref:DUF6082 family protein n=1 Tax=Streptomyces lutosisoli TaxID=2665721 RepID=A0ABW2VVY1_9ACTN
MIIISAASQAYERLSVFFSAVAMLGVVASLAYQARQTSITNMAVQRASHRELVLFALQHPELMLALEPLPEPVTKEQARQMAFSNLFLSNWWDDFVLRRITVDGLRVLLRRHFRSALARQYWEMAGAYWRHDAEVSSDRRLGRFVDLVDEQYAVAIASGPAMPPTSYFTSPNE